jgi:hypothetical protein
MRMSQVSNHRKKRYILGFASKAMRWPVAADTDMCSVPLAADR